MQLLKYDFRAMWKICLPAYALTALGFVWNLILGQISFYYQNSLPEMVSAVLGLIYNVTNFFIYLLVVATIIWVITDFYKSVFGKIGYLTHTLPVSAHQILLSKLLIGVVMILLSTAITAVVQFILFWTSLHDFYPYTLAEMLSWGGFWAMFFSGIFALICATILQILSVFSAIALAHLTKHKIALSVIFSLISYQVVGNIPMIAVIFAMMADSTNSLMNLDMAATRYLMVYGLSSLVLSPIFYYITHNVMKNKLNLE